MAASTYIYETERQYRYEAERQCREWMLRQQQAIFEKNAFNGWSGLLGNQQAVRQTVYDWFDKPKIKIKREKSFREELQAEIDEWLG